MGNRHPTIVPYETFAASDGDFVLAVGNDDQWRRFCGVAVIRARRAVSRPIASESSSYDELKRIVGDALRGAPAQHWIERLEAAGVPCGSVRDLDEVFTDPQLTARDMIARVEHATVGPLRLPRRADEAVRHAGGVRTAAADARAAHRRGARDDLG